MDGILLYLFPQEKATIKSGLPVEARFRIVQKGSDQRDQQFFTRLNPGEIRPAVIALQPRFVLMVIDAIGSDHIIGGLTGPHDVGHNSRERIGLEIGRCRGEKIDRADIEQVQILNTVE